MNYTSMLVAFVCSSVLVSASCTQGEPHSSYRRSFKHVSSSSSRDGANNKEEHFEAESIAYETITTSTGVLEYIQKLLNVSNISINKTITIKELTGSNDFAHYQALKSLDTTNPTVSLHDVTVILKNGSITILFKTEEDGAAYKIAYNVQDEKTRTFADGIETLQPLSSAEFTAEVNRVNNESGDFFATFESSWKKHQEEMNHYFDEMEHAFNNLFISFFSQPQIPQRNPLKSEEPAQEQRSTPSDEDSTQEEKELQPAATPTASCSRGMATHRILHNNRQKQRNICRHCGKKP